MAKFITLTFNDGNAPETFQLKGDVKPTISGGTLSIGEKTFLLPTIASMDETTKRITPARDAKVAAAAGAEKGYNNALALLAEEVASYAEEVASYTDDPAGINAALERDLPAVFAMYTRWQEAQAALVAHDTLCEKARLAAKAARENPKPKAEKTKATKPAKKAAKK